MEIINLPLFYQLGARLNPLTQLDPYRATRGSIWGAGFQVKSLLNTLLSRYPALHVCRAVGQELLDAITVIDQWSSSASSEEWNQPPQVTDFQFRTVVSKAKEFETVLSHELNVLAAYQVTSKGAYSTADLIERADLILSESVRAKMPTEVLEDIKQAGRCLALDSPTASGFHMMRALEGVLHQYYLVVCKPKKRNKLDNWGAYLAALRKVAGEGEDDEDNDNDLPKAQAKIGDPQVRRVITFLHQVKDTRNNIMHPELVLSVDEAFHLLDVTKTAIFVMADRLSAKETKGD